MQTSTRVLEEEHHHALNSMVDLFPTYHNQGLRSGNIFGIWLAITLYGRTQYTCNIDCAEVVRKYRDVSKQRDRDTSLSISLCTLVTTNSCEAS
jgi:hypothetical protein